MRNSHLFFIPDYLVADGSLSLLSLQSLTLIVSVGREHMGVNCEYKNTARQGFIHHWGKRYIYLINFCRLENLFPVQQNDMFVYI